MKHRFQIHLALLLLVAMLLPTPVMAESLTAAATDEVYNLEQATQPEELPEFQLVAPETEDTQDTAVTVMSAPADTDIPKAATTAKLTLGVKEKYTLKVSGAKKYETSDKTIATVSKKGIIVAKKAGKATITATDKKGKQTKIKVTVKKAPAKVKLNKTKYTLTIGKTLQLKAKLPSGSASNKITWTSSRKSVATVDANGKVLALKAGKAKITIKTFNGKKATCTITVKNPNPTSTPEPTKQSLDSSSVALALGINEAYKNAKYPSTLHIKSVYQKEGIINGYGDTITRTVIEGYAMNGLGGYGSLYVVILTVPNNGNYDVTSLLGYYYTVYVCSSNPGIEKQISNEIAEQAYKAAYGASAKKIVFD